MCSIVCILPQSQLGDESAPILCRKCFVRPTPVLMWLRFNQAFIGRSQPAGFAEGSGINSFRLVEVVFHWSDQRSAIQVGKVEGGLSSGISAVVSQRKALICKCGGAGTRQLSSLCFLASFVFCASRLSWAGGVPESIGRLLLQVWQWMIRRRRGLRSRCGGW